MNARDVWRFIWRPLTPGRPHHSIGAVAVAVLVVLLLAVAS